MSNEDYTIRKNKEANADVLRRIEDGEYDIDAPNPKETTEDIPEKPQTEKRFKGEGE